MATIKIGNLDMTLKLGSVDVSAAYLGDTKLYPTTPPSFDGKWKATYSGGSIITAACDSSSAITVNEIESTNLESVVIGDCVTSIGDYAFNYCTSLSSVTIPNSVTSISDYVFQYCYSLTSIDIPNSVTSIGDWAFSDCTSLASIDIPSGVTYIGDYAFTKCSSLTSITVRSTTPPSLYNSFNNTPIDSGTGYIYVPSQSVETYKSTVGWSDYASRIQAIPNS